jgi:hypothetical protein
MLRVRWRNEAVAGWRRLAVWVIAIAVIWLAVLPFLGEQSDIRAYVERNEALGIDPTAKFYTELPAMPDIFDRMQSAQRRSERTRTGG